MEHTEIFQDLGREQVVLVVHLILEESLVVLRQRDYVLLMV